MNMVSNNGVKIGGGHCGIHAIAYISGKDINEVFDDYRELTGKTRRYRGSTREAYRNKLLRKYGIKIKKVPFAKQTFRKWLDDAEFQLKGKVYIVRTTGHVQVVDDGIVIDQHGHYNKDLWSEMPFKNKIVKSVILIEGTI